MHRATCGLSSLALRAVGMVVARPISMADGMPGTYTLRSFWESRWPGRTTPTW